MQGRRKTVVGPREQENGCFKTTSMTSLVWEPCRGPKSRLFGEVSGPRQRLLVGGLLGPCKAPGGPQPQDRP